MARPWGHIAVEVTVDAWPLDDAATADVDAVVSFAPDGTVDVELADALDSTGRRLAGEEIERELEGDAGLVAEAVRVARMRLGWEVVAQGRRAA